MVPSEQLLIVWVAAVVAASFNPWGCRADVSMPRTDPSEVAAVNAIFRKWNISAMTSKAKWNESGDICWGLPMQIGQNFESDDRNPYIVCNCEYEGGTKCHVTKLKVLELGVMGRIPDELQNLTYLENLQIARNYLSGPLPSFIGNFTRMEYLSVGRNALSGPIPKELGKLKALRSLGIDTCNFSGPLPEEMGNMSYLEQMYILSMGASGEIPSTFAKLKRLQTWWAGDNSFGGKVPAFIGNMTELQSLKFQGNSFQGPIPASFSNLEKLTLLYLTDVSGESSSLGFIKNMSRLENLILRNSKITDVLPQDIQKYGNLSMLDLSFNNLSGVLPSNLFKLSNLQHLYLGNNSFTGSLPDARSEKLVNIDLSYNNLSGQIPSWQSDTELSMNLVANNFDSSSNLPWNLGCLQNGFTCYPGYPVYSSFAIDCGGDGTSASDGTSYDADNENLAAASYFVNKDYRWAVSSTGKFLGVDNLNYTENNSTHVTNTADPLLFQSSRVSPSSLRYYGLSMENGEYNVTLQFAEIHFPDDHSLNSHGRRIFDIYIQGTKVEKDFNIKKEAGNKAFKAVVRNYTAQVTKNYLEIHFFWGGKGTTAIPRFGYQGPSISAIRVSPNFKPNVPNRLPSKKNKKGLIIGLTLGISSALFIFLFCAFIFWRRKRQHVDEELEGLSAITFSLSELKNATKDFSSANKLGQGGYGVVFKGKLHDGRMVAVKQLAVASFHGKRQFVSEIAAISTVQHRNLVKLYGCCYEGGHRLLVYEYLENKSLDLALFGTTSYLGKGNLQLDWPSRYNICMGAARGLAYLHEESRVRIIHRDVKASNILLDADLNPKIADFGLAKLYDDKMTHLSTKVAGTVGYLAPEYALRGHLTEKADIFGFGIVVLEILTGKPNYAINSAGEKTYLLERVWELHENNDLLKIMDRSLPAYNKDEAMRMIGVALLCTQTDPNQRLPMSRVVAMLAGDIEISSAITKPAYLEDWKYDEEHYGANANATSSFTFVSSSRFGTDESSDYLLPGADEKKADLN